MRWQIPLVVVLALFAVVSCDQQPVEPLADQVAEAPAFNFSNNSDAGPNIVRFEGELGYIISDYKKGIQALLGLDPADVCAFASFDLVDIQDIYLPNEVEKINSLAHGDDIRTSVWDFPDFDCVLYGTETPLATGTSRIRQTDNDVTSFLWDHENANAFGLNAHGVLDNGMLNAHERVSWDPATGRFNVSSVVNFH